MCIGVYVYMCIGVSDLTKQTPDYPDIRRPALPRSPLAREFPKF